MDSTIGNRPAKDALFDVFSQVAASLASGRRLEILDVLAQAPRTVEVLAAEIGQSVANTSHHLRRLAADGLVGTERSGRHVSYRLASPRVHDLLRSLEEVAMRHNEGAVEAVEGYVGDRTEIGAIDWETLESRRERGERIVVIDVRPTEEFDAGHIDGAISMPPEHLEERLDEIPDDGDVVAYCRGTYCAYADRAVRALMSRGRVAFRLDGGFRDVVPLGPVPREVITPRLDGGDGDEGRTQCGVGADEREREVAFESPGDQGPRYRGATPRRW